MRTFEKSSKLNDVCYDIRGPVMDEASRMEQEGMNILKLNIGNPAPFGFTAPEEVILDMRNAIVDSQGYSDLRRQHQGGALYAHGCGNSEALCHGVWRYACHEGKGHRLRHGKKGL